MVQRSDEGREAGARRALGLRLAMTLWVFVRTKGVLIYATHPRHPDSRDPDSRDPVLVTEILVQL